MAASKKQTKTINLALQGGGAHGAFAWGALDALLEDGRIDIEGVCAASAGAMNAIAYASGNLEGGKDGAREKLHNFWWQVHQAGQAFNPIKQLPWERFFTNSMDHSLSYGFFDGLFRTFSPYQLNPFDFNPLRDVLAETIDFEALKQCDKTKLYISATHVQSGKLRVFSTPELSIDVVMASACLPFIYKAVSIEGEDYWDGGYMGNPALYPLFYDTQSRDILIVHINPIDRPETPHSAPDIMNRINEISFNSSLIKEMRSIAFVKKLLEKDMLKDEYRDSFKDILLHSLRAEGAMCDLSVASKFSSDWGFLTMLRDKGREYMGQWLEQHYDAIGVRETVDLQGEFLNTVGKIFDR
ncbi:patatin-like phospholipase family protein [Halioxenophilus aromaticivorans]|uniref:Patatin-like phospholipase family protein n=1 Tax=Halioxenophilus aromaticivorans TaxID=1306992 RepID=A0AAV3U904_9ALTE